MPRVEGLFFCTCLILLSWAGESGMEHSCEQGEEKNEDDDEVHLGIIEEAFDRHQHFMQMREKSSSSNARCTLSLAIIEFLPINQSARC